VKWRTAVGVVTLGLGGIALAGSVFHSLPSNVVSDTGLRSPLRIFSVDLAPQGWGFFTRDPSEADLLYYEEDLQPAWTTPQGRPENLYGLSRTQRAQGPEAAALLESVGEDDWFECMRGATFESCVEGLRDVGPAATEAENASVVPTLCGTIVFAQSDPVPWSYRHLYEDTHIPRYVTEVSATCE